MGYLKSNHDINVSFSCSSHNLKFTPRVSLVGVFNVHTYLICSVVRECFKVVTHPETLQQGLGRLLDLLVFILI